MTVDVLESEKTHISKLTRAFTRNMREKHSSMGNFRALITQDGDVDTHISVNLGKPLSSLHYTSWPSLRLTPFYSRILNRPGASHTLVHSMSTPGLFTEGYGTTNPKYSASLGNFGSRNGYVYELATSHPSIRGLIGRISYLPNDISA